MALPPNIKKITVTHKYTNPDGSASKGSVSFSLSASGTVPADGVSIPPVDVTVALDVNGAISVDLPASDDPHWAQTGLVYKVTERISGASPNTFSIVVPYNAVGGVSALASLAPVVAGPASATYVLAAQVGATSGVASLGPDGILTASQRPTSAGAVTSVAGRTGAVTLVEGDIANLTADLAAKATDSAVVHLAGAETVAGVKTFSVAPVVPAAAFPETAISNLTADLAARTLYRGAWVATTTYAVNDLVTLFDTQMLCKTAHTSGTTFALTNWTPLGVPANTFKPEWYGAVGNDKYVTDGAMTAASATFTSATASFSAADIGKAIMVRGAAASTTVLLTTISAYVSPTQVTLTVAASTTVSAAYASYGTDDTAAINSAINAATTYITTRGGARVKFRPAWYAIAGALIQGGATKTNSQIPLPIASTTANSGTLDLEGSGTADNIPHWQQTVGQRAGTVLHSYVTGTNHGTFGEASVIGGPTPQQGYGSNTSVFSNLLVHIDQIEVLVPNTANGSDICGVDLRGIGKCHIGTLACLVDSGPTNITVGGGAGWAFGLALPNPANNAKLTIYSYSCEGFTYGLAATEHLAAVNVLCVYCYTGILIIGSFFNSSGAQHVAYIAEATVEACVNGVQWVGGGKAVINVLTVEGSFAGGMHVADTNGSGSGQVNLGGIINTIQVSDPTNVRVIYLDGTSGNAAAPAMPASTVAPRNPFWRDCAVTITGGTVTAIMVDGVATGLTSGTVIVPSGRRIAITYSVAPTWVWTKL